MERPPVEQRPAVLAQALDHPPRPAPPLAGEGLGFVGGAGEGDRGALVADPATVAHHRPGEDDVLADPVGPAARLPQRRGAVDAEGALGDHRALEEALLALDRGDPEEVVPLLGPGEKLLRELRTKTAPATATVSGGEISSRATTRERGGHQQGVGVDRRHQRGAHLLAAPWSECCALPPWGKLADRIARVRLRAIARAISAVRSVEPSSATRTRSSPG